MIEIQKHDQVTNDEVDISKARDNFMKSACDEYTRSHIEFNAKLAVYKTANPKLGINDFVDTEEGALAKRACTSAHEARLAGPVARYTKAAVSELEKLDIEVTKTVEAFAVAHNLDFAIARKRLEDVSPTFNALTKRQAAANQSRLERAHAAGKAAEEWVKVEARKAARAEAEDIAKQAETRRTRMLSPSERKFDDRVGEIMKERGLARPAATVWAIDNDPIAKAIYDVTREERAMGPRP